MGFPQNLQHKDDISFDFQKTISVVIRGNLSILVFFFVLLQKLLIPPKKPFVEVLKEEGCAIFGVTPSSCKDSQPDIAFRHKSHISQLLNILRLQILSPIQINKHLNFVVEHPISIFIWLKEKRQPTHTHIQTDNLDSFLGGQTDR